MSDYDYSWEDQDPDEMQASLEFSEPHSFESPYCNCCDSYREDCTCVQCEVCYECTDSHECVICVSDDCPWEASSCDCGRCDECCDCKLVCQRCGDKHEFCVCPRCENCGDTTSECGCPSDASSFALQSDSSSKTGVFEFELKRLSNEFPSFAASKPFADDWEAVTKAAFALEPVAEPFPADVAADRKQLEQLASKGSVEAMKLIGVIHARAGENDLAVPWYEKAISLGNLDALSNLGVLRFGERKFEVGIDLLAAAANRGSKMAMRNLAICFARLKYEQASLTWHSRAAIFGDAKSAMSAAELYLGQNQRDKAMEMLRIAESLGVTEATAKLAEMGN